MKEVGEMGVSPMRGKITARCRLCYCTELGCHGDICCGVGGNTPATPELVQPSYNKLQ
jgi:hypothetical protein